MQVSMLKRQKEKELVNKLCANALKVIDAHALDKDEFLPLNQVQFSHGRADTVLYGLYKGLYVVPIGIEVKTKVESATELSRHVDQMREIYEHAFTHIYLAICKIGKSVEELAKTYLADLGYGLIKVQQDVDVLIKAEPKKTYRDERDYNKVTSRGLMYMAVRRALMDAGFNENVINVSSLWMGLNSPINYCTFLHGNYAVFGVYALGLQNVRQLLQFLKNKESLLQNLEKKEYRIYLESYLAVKGVRGYVHHLDEPISVKAIRTISNVMDEIKQPPIHRWGFGLGIYKRLWNIKSLPSYTTALTYVKDTLAKDQLLVFKECIQSRLESK